MSYKVVRNASNAVVAWGPNDSNYEPTIAAGCTLTIEETLPPPTSAELKATAKALVKSIRNAALAKFVANAGVAGVYDVNYDAAVAYDANNTTLVLRNGKTSGGHCTEFGALLGMTAAQFATYIIAENRQTSPTKRCAVLMHEIEGEYLRLYYSAIDAMLDAAVIAAPAAYQAFCDSRNP